jgi:hypothetical protein
MASRMACSNLRWIVLPSISRAAGRVGERGVTGRAVCPSMPVGLDIELCQNRKVIERDVFILVSFHVFESGFNLKRGQRLDYRLDDVPVWFKCGVWDWVLQQPLGFYASNEACIVRSEGAFECLF